MHWSPESDVWLPNPYLKNWLSDTGSLTERVQSLCRQFTLIKLGQGSAPLHDSECARLPGPADAYQVREVLLCADGVPWVYARSVIPQSLIDDELANLGAQPLGKRIFNDSRFVRSAFELCEVAPAAVARLNMDITRPLWGRRSKFSLNSQHMLVAEVFLPGAPVYNDGYHHD